MSPRCIGVRPRPTRLAILLLVCALGLVGQKLSAQPSGVEITTASGSDTESATARQLRRLLARYDLEPYLLMREVVIEDDVIPHSHPVLTLSTAYLDSDDHLLATFLHEQMHWLEDRDPAFRRAMARFAAEFPDAPDGPPQGARDLESTYRHLVVCDLELQALTALLGSARAREVLTSWRHYPWIYSTVLNDPRVRAINEDAGVRLPTAEGRGAP